MFFSCITIVKVSVFVVLYKIYRWWIRGARYEKNTKMDGKVIIVTGANTGIGKETALDLAKRGAKVYLACRNLTKAKEAVKYISKKSGANNAVAVELDLASFKSIRSFCNSLAESRIDVLINNAGVMACPKAFTEDGIELQMGVNHLGHFLLTFLLLDKLKKAAPSRIINVSSVAHNFGRINKDDLWFKNSYSPGDAYARSKLANVLFTKELARILQGTKVTANALHPGVIFTEICRHIGQSYGMILKPLTNLFGPYLMKTAVEGAQTTIKCAVDPDLEDVSGQYFSNCKITKTSKIANDPNLAVWLSNESVKLIQNEIVLFES